MSIEPNGVCQWCDIPHGGHQAECPAGELEEARAEITRLQGELERAQTKIRDQREALIGYTGCA
jgi:hypothetical protein